MLFTFLLTSVSTTCLCNTIYDSFSIYPILIVMTTPLPPTSTTPPTPTLVQIPATG